MKVGVLGAGTMGLGIAESVVRAGHSALVFEPDQGKRREAGMRQEAEGATGVSFTGEDTDLRGSDLVAEAVPEDISIKRTALQRALDICGPEVVLATNTSSLSVSALAGGLTHSRRLLGLHFFNPVPRMPLVELIRAPDTDADAVERAMRLVGDMNKTVIPASDTIGFVVNRCLRPFYCEALRIVSDGTATVEQVDGAMKALGFRMGPFELIDLVGVDVNLTIQQSFFEQGFGEPRWRPSLLQSRLVNSGRLGRKCGRGFYEYPRDREAPIRSSESVSPGEVYVHGETALAQRLREQASAAGWRLRSAEGPWLMVVIDGESRADVGPTATLSANTLLPESAFTAAARFVLTQVDGGGLAEFADDPLADEPSRSQARAFFGSLGYRVEQICGDPGLVSWRMCAAIVNEAHFALQEDVAEEADIDKAMRLGVNWPLGPFELGRSIGLSNVVATLESLQRELGDDRYRIAAGLRRVAARQPVRGR